MLVSEIAELLASSEASLGVVGQTIQRGGFSKDAPEKCLAVFEFPGEGALRVKDRREALAENPRFQIVARAKYQAEARILAEKAYRALDGFSGVAGGVHYQQITALQSPFYLDHDGAGRARIACNFRVRKELSPIT